jgi:hypothetical protein
MKTLKIIFVLIFFIGIFQNIFSQQIKIYNGPYKDGTATYQYYENEKYDRIYQGSFKYSSKVGTTLGQYDKNIKVGQWTITKETNPLYENIREVVTGKYINGNMDGLWTLERIDLKTHKILINSSVHFKDGYLIDELKYSNSQFSSDEYGRKTDLSLIGNFNNKGNFDSTWVLTYKINEIPFEDIKKLKDGFLYFNLVRNLSTGEIIEKYDDPNVPMKFYLMKHGYVYANKFTYYLTSNPNNIYSQVLELWIKVKTFDTYESEDLNIFHEYSHNPDLSNILKCGYFDKNDLIDERTIPNQLRFNSIVSKADSAFNSKQYLDTSNLYNEALRIPLVNTSYADSQLIKIEKINKKIDEEREKNNHKELKDDQMKTQKEAEESRGSNYQKILKILKKDK